MKLSRVFIFALLSILSIEVAAQSDSILVVSKDTVAYRYTPIKKSAQESAITTGRRGKFAKYIIESVTDQSFEKRVDMTLLPMLYYSPSTSAGLAVMAVGRYRLDKDNREIPASEFSFFGTASLTGYYRVGAKGCTIFRNDRQRIIYNAEFFSQPTLFWGVGYDAAMSNLSLRYLASRTIVDIRFMQRVANGLYLGVGADFNYHFGSFDGKKYAAKSDFMARLGGVKVAYNTTGVSLYMEYDTRDILSNPQRGVYLSAQAKLRPKGMGSVGATLWSGRLVFDYYQRLWRGAILAIDLCGEVNSKGTPWVYNASIGGVQSMRGYYYGRFNDLCTITLQAELRQKIYKPLGAVVWGGAGNTFSAFSNFKWRQTLPTYGVGLRFEIRKSVNLRLDYGFGGRDHRGKLIHGAVFSVNEAF